MGDADDEGEWLTNIPGYFGPYHPLDLSNAPAGPDHRWGCARLPLSDFLPWLDEHTVKQKYEDQREHVIAYALHTKAMMVAARRAARRDENRRAGGHAIIERAEAKRARKRAKAARCMRGKADD